MRLCFYCAAHFQWYTPVCPVCRRAAPPSLLRPRLPRGPRGWHPGRVPNYLARRDFQRHRPWASPRLFGGIVLLAIAAQLYHHVSEAHDWRSMIEATMWGLFSGVWWGGLLGGMTVAAVELF